MTLYECATAYPLHYPLVSLGAVADNDAVTMPMSWAIRRLGQRARLPLLVRDYDGVYCVLDDIIQYT